MENISFWMVAKERKFYVKVDQLREVLQVQSMWRPGVEYGKLDCLWAPGSEHQLLYMFRYLYYNVI